MAARVISRIFKDDAEKVAKSLKENGENWLTLFNKLEEELTLIDINDPNYALKRAYNDGKLVLLKQLKEIL